MDYEELAARAAVACWLGAEGAYARAIRSAKLLDMETLKGFLNLWKLARPNPLNRRTGLLDFLNAHARALSITCISLQQAQEQEGALPHPTKTANAWARPRRGGEGPSGVA
jgi:hypothetical protein